MLPTHHTRAPRSPNFAPPALEKAETSGDGTRMALTDNEDLSTAGLRLTLFTVRVEGAEAPVDVAQGTASGSDAP